MKLFISIFVLLMFTGPASASTAQELSVELAKILIYCKKVGFYKCQDRFEGTSRGVFHIPIELQKLKLAEKEFDEFIKRTYKNEFHASFFELSAYLKINTDDKFDIGQYLKNINHIQPINEEGTIYKFTFNKVEPLALIKSGGMYKLGVFPEQENAFKKSNSYTTSRVVRLKTNILRYHIKEAEVVKYDHATLNRKISQALAPIVLKLYKGDAPKYFKPYMYMNIKEVQRFYMPLNSESAILSKIKEEYKL